MALIVLLILTENENFTKDVHEMVKLKVTFILFSSSSSSTNPNPIIVHLLFQPIKKLPPNVDRQLTGVSLGGFLVLVLTRTIQHHLNQLRDKYLHINSLAALANLSPKIANLHPYVSQALVR